MFVSLKTDAKSLMSKHILCILDTKRSQKNTKITAFPDPPVNFYHVNEHKQKKSKRPAVWSGRKVTHRPISKLKNYKMQKASSLKRTTSHCWIFSFYIPVISRISKSDCTKVLLINFKVKIRYYCYCC